MTKEEILRQEWTKAGFEMDETNEAWKVTLRAMQIYSDKQLLIHSVVSSKITVAVTYLKWHDSGNALLDDYSTKETKIVKVDDIEQVNKMFANVIKIKVVK